MENFSQQVLVTLISEVNGVRKSQITVIITLSIIVILGLPIAIDWLIIGNNIPSNIANSDWVGFFGGYIGALIGALVSLVGIIITIRYTNEQNKKDRELQIRPYCSIRHVHEERLIGTNKIISELPIGCQPQENNGPRYVSILYLKNIGLGPAVEFKFNVDEIDDGREHYPILMQRNSDTSNRFVNLLQPGEEAALPIYIYFNFDPIREENFIELDESDLFKYTLKHEVMQKYKNFHIVIHVKYYDMYQNQYYQKITLSSNMRVEGKINEKQANHLCDINLKDVTTPIKIEKGYPIKGIGGKATSS